MEVLNYTEKSIVVFGDKTKDLKEQLKQLGGRFNPNLTHPETKEKLAGWIFSKKQEENIQNFIESGSVPVKLADKEKSVVTKTAVTQPQVTKVPLNRKASDTKTTSLNKSSDMIDDIVDPISRLGLKDNGLEAPVKKSRTTQKKKASMEKFIERKYKKEDEQESREVVTNHEEEMGSELVYENITPEFDDVPGFRMIIPKVGMQVKLKNKDGDETLLEIIHTIPNKDQFIFEFQARRKETDEIIDFVMVGKEWRRMVTETPHWMNFEK